MDFTLHTLNKLGRLESLSCILLFFLAMPLKYAYGMPLGVRVIGSVHGLLFIVYVLYGALIAKKLRWRWQVSVLMFLAACIPFGPLLFDRYIVRA